MKLYNTGKNKWKYGEVVEWLSNREPVRILLGPCPRCGNITSNYGGAYNCHNLYCHNSATMFVCKPDKTPEWWNSNIDIKLDGKMWCAIRNDFINLQESNVGFGNTPNDAVKELISLENN